jgi:two-component system chemotaxis response regulator CheB
MGVITHHRPIRIFLVDDSAVIRQILTAELGRDSDLVISGTAADPYIARDKIVKDTPDVIVLDIQMPKMDGLSFLKRIMTFHPLPVIIFSSIAGPGGKAALDALEMGAVAVLAKPSGASNEGLRETIAQLTETIKAAAGAKVSSLNRISGPMAARVDKSARTGPASSSREKVIVIGGSTGGTEALKRILTELPDDSAGVLAVIHMPEGFTNRYAQRLDEICAMNVREAADGDEVQPGVALIARGNRHLTLERSGRNYKVRVKDGELVCRHRPSVEVLFQSAAKAAGPNCLGIILTGMGNDGAEGLLALRKSGACTIAQNEETCVVYGMPREAVELNAAADVLPLDQIADACVRWSDSMAKNNRRSGA